MQESPISELFERSVREFVIDSYTVRPDGLYVISAGFATLILEEAQAVSVVNLLLKVAESKKERQEEPEDS